MAEGAILAQCADMIADLYRYLLSAPPFRPQSVGGTAAMMAVGLRVSLSQPNVIMRSGPRGGAISSPAVLNVTPPGDRV